MDAAAQDAGIVFRFDEESGVLHADFDPSGGLCLTDEALLVECLEERGWGALRRKPEAAAELLSCCREGRAVADLRLAQRLDAHFSLAITPDLLEAKLDLEPAWGGKAVTAEQILSELRVHEVSELNVRPEAIDDALKTGEAHGLVVAAGRPAIHGEDAWLECLVSMARSRVPQIDDLGHADFRDLGDIFAVSAGEALMRRHPPGLGLDGIDLKGSAIDARPGKDVQFTPGLKGVGLSPEDSNLLVAITGGQPVQVPGGMVVEPVYTVDAVNAASGNIRFDGSVVIRGDVQAGMTIKASADIEVQGVVEAATLDAGGDIVIKGGAIGGLGHKDNKHLMRCGGSFSAGYVTQARVEAGDSIFIDDMAMQCELIAINRIRVGDRKSGHIVGGRAQATYSITGKVLGSSKRVTTRFEIGVNPVIHKELEQIVHEREARETKFFELAKLIDFAGKNPGKVPSEMLAKVRATAAAINAEIEEIRIAQTEVEAKIELSRQSRVVGEQAVDDGVEVVMGGQRFVVSRDYGATAIGLDDEGHLGLLPLDDKPAP